MAANPHLGRPRSHDVDDSILQTAVELLATKGADALTVNAVARRTGVARASIYLRYPSRDALLMAALRAAIRSEPYRLTGDLETDLRVGAGEAQGIFATPSLRAVLPELVRGLLRQPDGPNVITSDMVAPNRRPLADAYRRSAEEGGLRPDIDPDLPFKLIVGGVFLSLVFDGVPPTVEYANQIADVVIAGLRADRQRPGASAGRDGLPARRRML